MRSIHDIGPLKQSLVENISLQRSNAPINVSRWGGGGGIGGGFDSSHHPVVGTFDRLNGLSSNILLTFSCHFDSPQMPWGGAFEQKLSAQFKCLAYARPSPPAAA